MKKKLSLVLAVAMLLAFSFGCAGYVSKETKLKCPKCGAVFTVDEALSPYAPGRDR